MNNSSRQGPSIFITVAEPSADQHSANLIRELLQIRPDLQIHAIGGEKMRAAGAIIHHESVAKAAMGWRAALRAREVAQWLRWTDAYYQQNKPSLHICCDSWSMNWRFALLAHQHKVPVLYYIAPQTWASREGRIHKLRRYVDQLACILPFEEQYFRQHHVNATYVGHPLFDELQISPSHDNSKIQNEAPASVDSPTIGILPGSRSSVANHNFPHQLNVARPIAAVFPNVKFLVPTTPVTHETVSQLASRFPNLTIDLNGFDRVVPQCDFCISVSGTAALHIAAYGVPFVIVYRVNPLHWHLVGRWVVKTRTYSLVNLLSGRKEHIVPEFIPWYGSDKPVADRVIDYLKHPEKMQEQRQELAEVIRPLNRPGASKKVAQLAIDMLNS
ncbi:MAG TPA: hypothetical protein VGG19_18005 [Tepidisphaeraceae bacterium]|jgi:lipid-A-disaccharide synthase